MSPDVDPSYATHRTAKPEKRKKNLASSNTPRGLLAPPSQCREKLLWTF